MADAARKIAPHAWEIMVRQQIVEGVVYSVGSVVLIVALLLTARRLIPEASKGFDSEMGPLPLVALAGLVGGAIFVACQVPQYVMQAANPEYYAIRMLTGSAR